MTEMTEEQLKNMTPEQIAEEQKKNCIFCKIIAGEIPSKKVYEDSDFYGILDINPAKKGHVLMLTKKHFQIMPQIPQDLVGKMGISVKKLSDKLLKSTQSQGTSIFIANGLVAGQKAPHFIIHLIPRDEGDNIGLIPELKDVDDNEFTETKQKIMSALGIQAQPSEKQKQPPQEQKEDKKENKEEADLDKISKMFT